MDPVTISGQSIYLKYITKSTPVIFQSNKIANFPTTWRDEFLKRKFGREKVTVQNNRDNEFSRYTLREYSHFESMPLSQFLKTYNSPKRNSNYYLKSDIKNSPMYSSIPNRLMIENEIFKTGIELQLSSGFISIFKTNRRSNWNSCSS
jgi:hypothetical protein